MIWSVDPGEGLVVGWGELLPTPLDGSEGGNIKEARKGKLNSVEKDFFFFSYFLFSEKPPTNVDMELVCFFHF